jgi:hypothetical protein
MSTNTRPANAEVVDTCTQRLKALKSYVPGAKAMIAINGKQTKVSDVIATYQACLEARATIATQRADLKATLVSRAAAEASRRATDKALKAWVINQFGADSKEAHDFGFPPPKAPVKSVGTKAQALVRSEATRKARHTMGKRQKQGVKGTKVVLDVPADPATTVQAAPPAASTPNTTTNAPTQSAQPSPQPTVTMPQNGAAPVTNGASPQH